MTLNSLTVFSALPFAAAIVSLLLAVASVLRKKPSPATWFFFAGMAVLGLDSLFTGLSLHAVRLGDSLNWLTLGFVVKCLLPMAWIGFSLTYSRGDARGKLARWMAPLALVALMSAGMALGFREQLIEIVPAEPATGELVLRLGPVAKGLNFTLLAAFAVALMNLEQTFRAAVGTTRWRIKFVVLGLLVIFGGQLYVRSQTVLFSVYNPALGGVESSALLIGSLLLVVAYARTGLAEAEVYPSRAVLRSSFTVLILGGYLFIVGVLAQLVRRFGGAESFQVQAFVILLGMAGLTVLLLSDRLRQRVSEFVGRHFRKAQHDSVHVWAGFSRRLARVKDETGLCSSTVAFVSETFEALTVSVWLLDDQRDVLESCASTSQRPDGAPGSVARLPAPASVAAGLRTRSLPFDLEPVTDAWAEELRQLNPGTFGEKGGHRWCVPLAAGDQAVGALVLSDRVNGAPFTVEEAELLRCLGDQFTSVLLNLRLANEVVQAREMEAFRTMSAFFVHDLKNAAASLNLMLKNLPRHFDNPEFRADALRGIGNTARRIDDIIARLSALRQRPDLALAETDLNRLAGETIAGLGELRGLALTTSFQPVPKVLADHEQLRSVVTNLLLNARDAVGSEGRIAVGTECRGHLVVLSVADNGCGMSEEFVRNSLFRPFQSMKKDGLGIGMFQARMVVEAHGGTIQVQSEPGRGTTFRVNLPARVEA